MVALVPACDVLSACLRFKLPFIWCADGFDRYEESDLEEDEEGGEEEEDEEGDEEAGDDDEEEKAGMFGYWPNAVPG